MNEIDWSKAPEWAKTVVRSGGSDGRLYWAEAFGTVSRRKRVTATGRGDEDTLVADMTKENSVWTLVEIRPTTPSWSGEGLPPVGVRCEAAIPHTSGPNNERSFIWIEGSVIAYYEINDKTYAWFSEDDGFYPPAVLEFRPIRTPEQIADDNRAAEINAMEEIAIEAFKLSRNGDDITSVIPVALYDAGYRKP